MTKDGGDVADLRARWEQRAAENPMFYINADRREWTAEEFLRSGEEDVARFAVPAFDRLLQPPGASSALDIGCGLGRLTRALAAHFKDVVGIDISATMIEEARTFAGGAPPNIALRLCDGSGAIPVPSGSVHFVFSYIVFQHVPTASIIRTYFSETARVMAGGAIGRLQVNTRRRRLRERIRWGIVPSDRVPIIHRKPRLRVDPHSTMGVVLTPGQCRSLCADNGLDLVDMAGVDDQYTWLTVRKRG